MVRCRRDGCPLWAVTSASCHGSACRAQVLTQAAERSRCGRCCRRCYETGRVGAHIPEQIDGSLGGEVRSDTQDLVLLDQRNQAVQSLAAPPWARWLCPTESPQDNPSARLIRRKEHGRGGEVGVHDALAMQVGHAIDKLLRAARAD